jgi:DNA-binding response OmpR family regulator
MPRLAVVDDEPGIRTLLEIELGDAGFEVRSADDGAAGLELVRGWDPDLILLDLMMPKISGIDLLPMLRRYTQAPIVVLSAKGGALDKALGLERGADHYIGKPFEVPELVAFLRTALRRPSLAKPDFLTCRDLTVDLQSRSVERSGRMIALSKTEFDLLVALMREPRRVLTREQLLDEVWGDRNVTPNAVDTYVSYVRTKVDLPFDEQLIRTIRGVGYTMKNRTT